MGQRKRPNYVAVKGALIVLMKEECASSMEQNVSFVAVKGALIIL